MGLSVEDVISLNERIESINVKRTKIETQQEMLRKRLEGEVAEYEKAYGVSLKGKDLNSTIDNIRKEANKVHSKIKEEYEFKSKLVGLIEDGDIEGANKMLGIESPKEGGAVEATSADVKGVSSTTAPESTGIEKSDEVPSTNNTNPANKSQGMPGYDDIADDVDDEPTTYNIEGSFLFDGDDEEETSASDAENTSKDDAAESKTDFGVFGFDFGLDDSVDDISDDFGMKSILGGSKFDFD